MLEYWYRAPGAKSRRRANRLFGELRQRRMLLAQFVVIGQLIGQAGDVRQQVTDRHIVPPIARECGQELLHAVIELKLPLIEQSHDGRHVDRLGNGAEQEHRVARGRLAEVARKRLVSLNHVQHGRIHLLRRVARSSTSAASSHRSPRRAANKGEAFATAKAVPRNVRRCITLAPPQSGWRTQWIARSCAPWRWQRRF